MALSTIENVGRIDILEASFSKVEADRDKLLRISNSCYEGWLCMCIECGEITG